MTNRCSRSLIAMCAALIAAALTIIACGTGSKSPSARSAPAVAVVDGEPVSKASLDHWDPIEQIISRVNKPEQPLPRGLVPDPPKYEACAAYLRSNTITAGRQHALSTAQLKQRCRESYEATRQHMLQILITFRWLTLEAKAQGVAVSDHELNRHFAELKKVEYGSEQTFRKFLQYSGETLADELLLVKMDLLSSKLTQKVLREGGLGKARKYYAEFPKRWAAKTSCRPGYVIPECKQYRGPRAPEPAI